MFTASLGRPRHAGGSLICKEGWRGNYTMVWWGPTERAKSRARASTRSVRYAAKLAVCQLFGDRLDTDSGSQLFGHMRGRLRAQRTAAPGLFEYANGGNGVFLAAVGEIRCRLCRQNFSGDPRIAKFSAWVPPEDAPHRRRLIAATNRDLRGTVLDVAFSRRPFFTPELVRSRSHSFANGAS